MLDNYNVPAKMLFGTLVIFVFFILSFMILIGTYSDPLAKWLLLPTSISFGIALMQCLQNLKEFVDLKEDIAETEEASIILSTCPEYWVKDTVYVKDSAESSKHKAITVCKNYARTDDNKMMFVGGSTRGDTSSTFVQNYGNSGETVTDVITTMNNQHSESKDTFVEGFISTGDQYLHKLVTDDSNVKFSKTTKTNEDQMVTYYNADAVDSTWATESNDKMADTNIQHVHHTGDLIIHSHANDGHGDIQGPFWHSHDYSDTVDPLEARDPDIEDKWISEHNSVKGLEINLDKLNSASNICELVKDKFYWTEATNKCNFAK